jgi:hypothetical protein
MVIFHGYVSHNQRVPLFDVIPHGQMQNRGAEIPRQAF